MRHGTAFGGAQPLIRLEVGRDVTASELRNDWILVHEMVHLALPEVPPGAERIRLGSVDLAARRIAGHRGTAVVLADGDPGFFGRERMERARTRDAARVAAARRRRP